MTFKNHPNRWLCKEAKFKARALTTTRRAGGLDFSASGRKIQKNVSACSVMFAKANNRVA
jgi:hypothetical protein